MCCVLIGISWCKVRYFKTLTELGEGITELLCWGSTPTCHEVLSNEGYCCHRFDKSASEMHHNIWCCLLFVRPTSPITPIWAHQCLFSMAHIWNSHCPLSTGACYAPIWICADHSQTSISVWFSDDDPIRGGCALLTIS